MARNRKTESGQVLLVGIVMIVMLLAGIVFLFDVHNIIRAKLKLETAEEAAALSGAEWQKESLNLIGEMNLIKACRSLMVENSPLELEAVQQQFDLLTEMQTRVGFLGPLIGFAASQQAARANGMNTLTNLNFHLQGLTESNEYYLPQNQSKYLNNYDWMIPYKTLLQSISDRGIAVYPNAVTDRSYRAIPGALGHRSFYQAIHVHAQEIAVKDPPEQSGWTGELANIVSKWDDGDFSGKWWDVSYNESFPGQSEIFCLRVKCNDDGNWTQAYSEMQQHTPGQSLFAPQELLELTPGWFTYDMDYWDRQRYQQHCGELTDTHYENWYSAILLRSRIKPEYQYEGPVAYVEAGVKMPRISGYLSGINFQGEKRASGKLNETAIGAERAFDNDAGDNSVRQGVMAKCFGSLTGNLPPCTVELVLPVFNQVSVVPTYLPLPYDFSVLYPPSLFEQFLEWLAQQETLSGVSPGGTEDYLRALIYLCDGPGFRYYGFNPHCNETAFQARCLHDLQAYYDQREEVIYSQKNRSGPGWMQEPKIFSPAYADGAYRSIGAGNEIEKTSTVDGSTIRLHGLEDGAFFVIKSNGSLLLNPEPDPVRKYYGSYPTGGSSGGSDTFYVPDRYNDKKGVSRF